MPELPGQQLVDAFLQLREVCGGLKKDLFRTQRRVFRLDALEALRERGRAPVMPVEFRSQYGEDMVLWSLFDDQADGFFIEVGAYDGYTLSVSYVFEAIGWKGLLVEPLPDRAEQCRRRRMNSRVVHAALGPRGSAGTTTFEVVRGSGRFAEMHSHAGTTLTHLEAVSSMGGTSSPVSVPITTMNDALADHSGPIDFAVIDVEGGEMALLDGFDLERHRPRVILIEDKARGKESPIAGFLSSRGYTQVAWLAVNRVYVRADETELLSKAQAQAG